MDITCPKCHQQQSVADSCRQCGIVFSKYARRQAQRPVADDRQPPADAPGADQLTIAEIVVPLLFNRFSMKVTIFLAVVSIFLYSCYVSVRGEMHQRPHNKPVGTQEIVGNTVITYNENSIDVGSYTRIDPAETYQKLADLEQAIHQNHDDIWNLCVDFRSRWYNSAEPRMDLVRVHDVDEATRAAVKSILAADRNIGSTIHLLKVPEQLESLQKYRRALVDLNYAKQTLMRYIEHPEANHSNFAAGTMNAEAAYSMAQYYINSARGDYEIR